MPLPTPVMWFGGKTHLRDFILPHLEGNGQIYVEPFCGSANIFFAKAPHPVEVLNDLNGDIVNFFRILQNRRLFRHFAHRVQWTPYGVDELDQAIQILATPPDPDVLALDRAWAFMVRGSLGFDGLATSRGNWRRSFTSNNADKWQNKIRYLKDWRDRLFTAQIDHKHAIDLIKYWDTPDTVFYLDPPYVEESRISLNVYSHEMSNADHYALVDTLLNLKGRAVLSGYATSIYGPLESAGWARYEKTVISPLAILGNRERTEVLWVNRPGSEISLWRALPTSVPTVVAPIQAVVIEAPILSLIVNPAVEQASLW